MTNRRIIDGDGHILEDAEAIGSFLPAGLLKRGPANINTLVPPLDHFHSAHVVETPPGREGRSRNIGPEQWLDFLEDIGIESTVLYPTSALAYGKIVDLDWAQGFTRAYNDWLHATYLTRSPRFQGMALIPLQDPSAAVDEMHRAIEELGMCGVMLPSNGKGAHLGAKQYWPIYEAADRLGCAVAIHGGCHDGFGFDDLNVYAPVHAMGHPFGQIVGAASIVFNGILEKYPNMRIGFMEGGVAWFLMILERFDRSHATHWRYTADDGYGPHADEKVSDYILRHIHEGRIFIGCEGEEPALAYAVKVVGNKPWLYSSDFPHEVTNASCREEIEELVENDELTDGDKQAILSDNSERFYRLGPTTAVSSPSTAAAVMGDHF